QGRVRRKHYCLNMINGSALSGTRRHWALSSASKCQVSPPAATRSSSPRSSRHIVGAKAATAGSHFGFKNTWKLSASASVLVSAAAQAGSSSSLRPCGGPLSLSVTTQVLLRSVVDSSHCPIISFFSVAAFCARAGEPTTAKVVVIATSEAAKQSLTAVIPG